MGMLGKLNPFEEILEDVSVSVHGERDFALEEWLRVVEVDRELHGLAFDDVDVGVLRPAVFLLVHDHPVLAQVVAVHAAVGADSADVLQLPKTYSPLFVRRLRD